MLCMWNQLWAEAVLLVRTYAFFGNKKPILFLLLAMLTGVATYQMYAGIAEMKRKIASPIKLKKRTSDVKLV